MLNSVENRKKIDFLKFHYESLLPVNLDVNEVISLELLKLKELFFETGDKVYLDTALLHMKAFNELGFSYNLNQKLFDEVLTLSNTNPSSFFDTANHTPKKAPLKPSHIRSMIGRWPASPYNSHTITAAISDIVDKVSSKTLGTYYYYTAKKSGKALTFTNLYRLTVSEFESSFHDINSGKVYILED